MDVSTSREKIMYTCSMCLKGKGRMGVYVTCNGRVGVVGVQRCRHGM
jgi:hypothetical protein